MQTSVLINPIHIQYYKAFNVREKLLLKFFELIGPLHAKLYSKRPAWGLSTQQLLQMPSDSLGNAVGAFLSKENLEFIPHAERHDVFHVLLNYGTHVAQEAGMQFCMLGAGKKSPSVLGTVALAFAFMPEHWQYFLHQFRRGKTLTKYYKWPLQNMLQCSLQNLQNNLYKK